MKKNKLLWIVLPVSGILIVAVIVAAVLLISSQKKENSVCRFQFCLIPPQGQPAEPSAAE